MRLRPRLALTLAAASLPLAGGVVLLQGVLDRRAAEEALRQFALARMENGGREACEANPETFPGPPPRPGRGRGTRPPRPPEFRPAGPDGAGDFPPPPPGEDRGPLPGEGAGSPPPPPPPPPGAMADPLAPPRVEMYCYDATFASRNPKAPPFPEALRAALESGARHAADRFEDGKARGSRVAVRMAWSEGPGAVVLAWRPDAAKARIGPVIWGPLLACAGLLLAAFAAAGPVVRRVRRLTGEVQRAAADRYGTPVGVSGADEVADLARAFNEAGAAARAQMEETERREAALREFVANTTHDVMVPLTVLQGHLDSLRRGLDAGAPAEREKVLGALEETQYMASLVHNLGAAARLESGGPAAEARPVDLGRVVERAVERHRPVASPLGISVEFAVPEEPVTVQGDDLLLEQALSNLVHNGVRYNRSGGHVAVVLEAPKGGAEFALRVADDGPGVPDEMLPRLGERGLRGDAARTRRPEGQGLGLFIVRGACERHGFALAFRRSEGGGLEVEIRGKRG